MKIAVGSRNPVKVEAVQQAFELLFPQQSWDVRGIEVLSGVRDQPMSDEESILGANNRAVKALECSKADYGVGLEGGLQKIDQHWYVSGWAVVVDKNGRKGTGSSVKICVPPQILLRIDDGKELGIAVDEVFGLVNAKHGKGFFGAMTDDHITRTQGYRDAVISALASFLHPEVFE